MLISGGQTGVDRAALDWAIANGIDYGGYVPKGGLALDYPTAPGLLRDYPNLTELNSSSYSARNLKNVLAADATIILDVEGKLGVGTALTQQLCLKHHKPVWVIEDVHKLQDYVKRHFLYYLEDKTLNVAGSREKRQGQTYLDAMRMLDELFW